jgi:hypothetical protein
VLRLTRFCWKRVGHFGRWAHPGSSYAPPPSCLPCTRIYIPVCVSCLPWSCQVGLFHLVLPLHSADMHTWVHHRRSPRAWLSCSRVCVPCVRILTAWSCQVFSVASLPPPPPHITPTPPPQPTTPTPAHHPFPPHHPPLVDFVFVLSPTHLTLVFLVGVRFSLDEGYGPIRYSLPSVT